MLKLRYTYPVTRQLQFARFSGSVGGFSQEPIKFTRTWLRSRGVPAEAELAQVLWNDIQKKRFRHVESLCSSASGIDKGIVEPYLVAQAELLQPQEIKDTLVKVLEKGSGVITPAQVGILLHGYSMVDKLGSTERLIQQWLQNYIASHPSDTHAIDLHQKLVDGSASALASTGLGGEQNAMHSDMFDEAMKTVSQSEIPLSAWVALMRMYERRFAWRQCVDVLTYLEHKRDTKQAYMMDPTAGNGILMRNLSQFSEPNYIISTEFVSLTNVADDQRALHHLSRGIDIRNVAVLQWASLYNMTLRALVESNQYPAVLDLLRRMRALTGEEQGPNSFTQIPVAISLLVALSGPINPLQDLMASGGSHDSQDPVRYSIEVRQQLARSLSAPVASAVKSLAVPLHYLNEETDSTGYSLAKKYVMLLCRLDLLEECMSFIREVRTHVLNVRYGRPNMHNNFVSTTTIGGVETIDKIIRVCGFYEDGWMGPYFRRCREFDRWDEAVELYEELQETKRFEDKVRRTNLHLPENVTGPHLRQYRELRSRRENGLEEVDDFETPQQTVLKRNGVYLYHDTAGALRQAGELEKLAEFMSQHKVYVKEEE